MATEPTTRDVVRMAIYQHFARTGRAPAATDIATAVGRDVVEIDETFVALAEAHVLVLAPGTRSIWMAHPFSAVPTPYRVQCGGTSYWANCAWDAFGIAAILDRDTNCICRCPDCNQRMDLSVNRGGVSSTGMVHFAVPPRRFWDNVAYT